MPGGQIKEWEKCVWKRASQASKEIIFGACVGDDILGRRCTFQAGCVVQTEPVRFFSK